jgi:hypothetical protein
VNVMSGGLIRQSILFAAAFSLVFVVGLVHGRWTRRWSGSREVEAAVAALGRVPIDFGDWRGRPMELNREQLSVGEIDGYLLRHYEDPLGAGGVTMLVVCGRPGPISVHTPDICYAGMGYEPTAPHAQRTLPVGSPGRTAEFRHAIFAKEGVAVPSYLRILWSWSSGGAWEAPEHARFAFASRPALYKMYVIREILTPDERLEDDPSQRFLRALIPVLERTLSGAEGIVK